LQVHPLQPEPFAQDQEGHCHLEVGEVGRPVAAVERLLEVEALSNPEDLQGVSF
jgi:hypothetical protein